MRLFLERLLCDTGGASFIDFSLIAAFVSLVIVAIVAVIGSDIDKPFQAIAGALTSHVSHP
jgi:Flp pilus assembly pilin Flp